jgi:mannose-6-phosphate isomerase-like protein (cupin superfamily)
MIWTPRLKAKFPEEEVIKMRTAVWGVAAFAALMMVNTSAPAAEMGKGAPTYVDSQKVLDQFGKASLLVPGDGAYEVQTNRRVKDGNIEIHVKETDIFYVMDGSATLLMGGTVADAHPGRPDRPLQLTGKDITNPEVHELKKGDVIVIPAGVPHWFKSVHGSIDYLVVKSIKP